MSRRLKWFGVRIFLRRVARGRAIGRDAYYDASGTLVEERIVIVRARDARDAFARMRRRVQSEGITYKNAYGQVVKQELLSAWEAYELFDPPSDGAEVFSRTTRVPASTPNRKLVAHFSSPRMSAGEQRKRRRFIAAELAKGLDVIWDRQPG
jgi:hypothetical protein